MLPYLILDYTENLPAISRYRVGQEITWVLMKAVSLWRRVLIVLGMRNGPSGMHVVARRKSNTKIVLSMSGQFSSVAQPCLSLCDPMDCRTHASLSITNSGSLLKLLSIDLVMPFNHLTLCYSLLLLLSIFPIIRVFSDESVLWPKCWSFSFSISPSNKYSGLISFRMDCLIFLQSRELSRVFSNTTVQKRPWVVAARNLGQKKWVLKAASWKLIVEHSLPILQGNGIIPHSNGQVLSVRMSKRIK